MAEGYKVPGRGPHSEWGGLRGFARLLEAIGSMPSLQALKSAVTLPGDVYAGHVLPTSEEALPRAMALAGLGMSGGLAAPVRTGAGEAVLGSGPVRGTGSFELDYFGTPIRILQNPSPRQAEGFLARTKYKAARRITDPETGDVYIWDANDPALHAMVAQQLGVKYDPKYGDMIGLD